MRAYVPCLGPRAIEASGSQTRPLKEPDSGVRTALWCGHSRSLDAGSLAAGHGRISWPSKMMSRVTSSKILSHCLLILILPIISIYPAHLCLPIILLVFAASFQPKPLNEFDIHQNASSLELMLLLLSLSESTALSSSIALFTCSPTCPVLHVSAVEWEEHGLVDLVIRALVHCL